MGTPGIDSPHLFGVQVDAFSGPLSRAGLVALTGDGVRDVMAERVRQIEVEGFDLAHDLGHHPGELGLAAASYLNTAIDQLHGVHHSQRQVSDQWPWQGEAWRPGDARANIVKAIALGLALLDRIDHVPAALADAPAPEAA